MTKIIETNQGHPVRVSDEDYDYLSQWKWYILTQGKRRYVIANVKQPDGKFKTQYMHRMLMPVPPTMRVLHRDCDGLNNQRDNLYITHKSALPKFREDQSSKFKGVRKKTYKPSIKGLLGFTKRREWEATIRILGKQYSIGSFDTEEEAAAAHDRVAADVYGQFGFQNCKAMNMGKDQVFFCPDGTYRKIMEDGRVVVVDQHPVDTPMFVPKRAYSRSKSGFRGVRYHNNRPRSNPYEAVITRTVSGITSHISLGSFGTPEEAARAYDKAAFYWDGPTGYFNFPEEILLTKEMHSDTKEA